MITTTAVATWRVWVTEADLRDAREAWLRARDGGAPDDRVLELREDLDRMTRTAVYQALACTSGTDRAPGDAVLVTPAAAPVVPAGARARRVPPGPRMPATG